MRIEPRDMKYFIVILLLMLSLKLVSQSVYGHLPADSLIKKFHVKTITTYYSDDSTKDELEDVWKFDTAGQLISQQLFDIDDTTLDIDMYFYNAKLLMEYWQIATWDKYDTIITKYIYDQHNRISKELINGKANGIDYYVTYTYLNDSITLKEYNGKGKSSYSSGIDSLVYNPDKSLKDLFNISQELRISYKYNLQQQLVSVTQLSIYDSNDVINYKKYIYEKGQLITEIYGYQRADKNQKDILDESFYFYNDNGLINKIERSVMVTTYKYEYFK